MLKLQSKIFEFTCLLFAVVFSAAIPDTAPRPSHTPEDPQTAPRHAPDTPQHAPDTAQTRPLN